MAFKNRDSLKPILLNPEAVTFSVFTTEEIKKLCVAEIVTPLTFDALGFPYPGGLHDKRLGPISERGEPCGTCQKGLNQCPGHFGYIQLPMPVINPLFWTTVLMVMKKSCLTCYQMQVPKHLKRILAIQINLLNSGRLSEAVEIGSQISLLIAKYELFDAIPDEELASLQLENLNTDLLSVDDVTLNKSTEILKNQFIRQLINSVTTKKSCIHCKSVIERITHIKMKMFVSTRQKRDSGVSAWTTKHIGTEEAMKCLREVWRNDKEFLGHLVPLLKTLSSENPTDVFFLKMVTVTPTIVRPPSVIQAGITNHPQTDLYKAILQETLLLKATIKVVQNDTNILTGDMKAAYDLIRGKSPIEKLNNSWEILQGHINGLMDRESKGSAGEAGLKQIIEKKDGIIRKHMMGKRVNFAARSVITPDPNINIDEIGVPEAFAKQLTYPVPVTVWNVELLRKLIMNGPDVHPGAVTVEFEDGKVIRISNKDPIQRESLLKRLLTPDGPDKGFRGLKLVHRHLCNGDVLLLNRQPSLHKPSIMAHTARVLKSEKTLRLHYANCKAYNADFDGDEMNAHFPQNELSRSEAYTLANVSNQYLVPKDGTPLSGLIQDHMISGVKLSLRGKFFNRDDYQQLVYQALSFKLSPITLLPPTILKPKRLWSGKQVLSTVILNIIPKGVAPINMESTAKISAKAWEVEKPRKWKAGGTPFKNSNDMTEAEVVIRCGELLVGILDKAHYGATPYGLVHCMYELYGGGCAIKLLSSFAKLFTYFLQYEGFTLSVHDILVLAMADDERTRVVEESRLIGAEAMAQALNIGSGDIGEIIETLEEQSATNPKIRAIIDRQYKSSLDSYTNDINKVCLPAGLICKFPYNNLQLMVQSGAKGSTVNTMQISCLLGQIELEGKRPPAMINGKSLPSFPTIEFSPRAGGFIDGRFMTGIQPQEFFFHCMAGREGLIDTAVKTSRSGYLQRCLIKHLEGLNVAYDLTVRDSDKSVVQFFYGEDGMDISKAQFLNDKQLSFMLDNYKAIVDRSVIKTLKSDEAALKEHTDKLQEWLGKHQSGKIMSPFTVFSAKTSSKVKRQLEDYYKLVKGTGREKRSKFTCQLWRQAGDDIKQSFKEFCTPCPDPLASMYQPDCYFGSINERLAKLISDRPGKSNKKLANLINYKAMHSLAAPGEPVGLLAAQSIGEPSTQMTLNTFHFAGRGEMNVTLGIPRLREILMMASARIKTPSMEVPFLNVPKLEEKAEKLKKIFTRVVVADVLEKIIVKQEMHTHRREKITLKFYFLPYHLYKSDYNVTPGVILKYMGTKFFKLMFMLTQKHGKMNASVVTLEEEKKKERKTAAEEDDRLDSEIIEQANDVSDDDEAPEDPEDAKNATRYQQLMDDQAPELDEEQPDEEEPDENVAINMDESYELTQEEIESMESTVLQNQEVHSYSFDKESYGWCELSFLVPLTKHNTDMTAVLKDIAGKAVLWETPGIKRAIVYKNNEQLMLKTDGINLVEMFKYNRLLDLNKLYSNDIHQIANTYGIEAAMRVVVREVRDVFKVYGITVDPRHLLLIADYMTFSGRFEPLNRKGMENDSSPLHQLSFESSLQFLKSATINGKMDNLENPSSCLMIGKPCNTGTGAFTLMQKLSACQS